MTHTRHFLLAAAGEGGAGGGEPPKPPATPPATPPPGTPPAPTPPPSGEPKPGTPPTSEPPKPGGTPPAGTPETPPANAAAELAVQRPEGIKEDDALFKGFVGRAKEAGLNGEQASGIAKWFAEESAKAEKAAATQWDETKKGWQKQLTEKHGAKFDEAKALAQKGLTHLGGAEALKAVAELDLSDHPVLFEAFRKAGEMVAEDTSRVPTSKHAGLVSRDEKLKNLYRNMKPQ